MVFCVVEGSKTYRTVVQRLAVGTIGKLGSELGELLVTMDGKILLVVLGLVEELLSLSKSR